MAGVNKVIIIGNVCKEVETRFMPSGGAVSNLTVATNEKWKDKNTGEQKEKAEFHRVVMFGKLAEIAGEYLKKGSKVYLEGKLQTRKWVNQQGQDQYTTEVVLEGFSGVMQMLDGKSQSAGQQAPQQQTGYRTSGDGGGFATQQPKQFNQQPQQQGGYQNQPNPTYQQPQQPAQGGGFNNQGKQ